MKLGILTIATNHYLEYFEDLVKSFVGVYPNCNDLEWYLFTNRVAEAKELSKNLPFNVTILEVPPYAFPEATLFRYKMYVENSEWFDADLLIHLDADMLVKSDQFLKIVKDSVFPERMTLIEHPGYFRPIGTPRAFLYFRNPRYILIDLLMKIKFGGIGSWETNINSKAFVPRPKRKKYFCGGIWFGNRETVVEMCEELSHAINQDLAVGIIAKWHDESHLNAFASRNKVEGLSPELCFEPKYPNLNGLNEIVRVVDKNEK